MEVKVSDLAQWATDDSVISEELSSTGEGLDEVEGELASFVTSTTDNAEAAYKALGLWYEDGVIHYDPKHGEQILALAEQVTDEYEGDVRPSPLWDEWELQGDDDVDYNGSYIVIIVETLNRYIATR